ncbi:2,3-dihydroxybenzoate decarboxylase [Rhizobium sp. BK226]|jgi:predicted TIM-barrel fold metal-dependent hydrolase|uniref:Gamma-resorcylate decarboxylase n=1 Tax=Rhizobium anhuiense TaxID=1184720 RepID=A0A3S0QFI0_9HYPH|nr:MULTISPECIES: gamma-resorcylate decarboxylase [Rhizobium]KZS56000.1 amidohydrolase [Rhizobium anhuiense bv. trifolii]MBB3301901.1 2,3-dihydroxybenzoate decarboxylase [Rhizobium sp. BK112]MBB3371108.1 2,3-dihydroxybenzoate decarboxylase [Rhizobium sp. BK077]MBB3746390.1 2,3-dihydroxybenzoate decarboxylase [Rhizobium sp. BK591]MBB4116068.1 2,3-dihydroxybenzoate decarboxylase [Rhizobium sp. BK226]
MQGKIALEEHFAIPETLMDSAGFVPGDYWTELQSRLLDIQDKRLKLMDAHGIETMILSLNAPAVQAIAETGRAIDIARRANDALAEECAKRPDRFRAFAALPLQDPEAAARELERCVKDMGFVGALVNGFSQRADTNALLYYDLPQYRGFWATVAALDVPFYLHPRNPLAEDSRIYEGHPWLMGPTWAFAQETAVHALRLMGSGLFDEHPNLRIILGHMGEGLPYMMWRIDNRNAWVKVPPKYPAKRRIADYFNENFYITTSGNFRTQTLIDAMLEIGADRILFSTDWPFENIDHAADWFDTTTIAEADRVKIGRTNAKLLFGI